MFIWLLQNSSTCSCYIGTSPQKLTGSNVSRQVGVSSQFDGFTIGVIIICNWSHYIWVLSVVRPNWQCQKTNLINFYALTKKNATHYGTKQVKSTLTWYIRPYLLASQGWILPLRVTDFCRQSITGDTHAEMPATPINTCGSWSMHALVIICIGVLRKCNSQPLAELYSYR